MTQRRYDLSFHHYGLAVKDAATAQRFLSGIGYQVGAAIYDPLQRVNLYWCTAVDLPAVEIVCQADVPGPLDHILAEQDALVYHLCFESPNIDDSISLIRNDGHRAVCVSPPKPAVLFGGKRVGFYLIKGFGLIELLEQ